MIAALGGTAVAWPSTSRGQQPKVLRVGYSGMLPRRAPHYAAFEKRMIELGYREGSNFTFEYIQSPGIEGYELTYREFVAREVDILMAAGNESALRAARVGSRCHSNCLPRARLRSGREGLCVKPVPSGQEDFRQPAVLEPADASRLH
jgi:hypothetical protein